ncbi:MAG: hypothetical protein K2J01_04290 [Clostridiales bacterium]|nr:hypothetical protein [Clostridiales bacterium]
MKKAIKLIISAASALSIVGVGAASFANWQSDTDMDKDYAANNMGLGHISAAILGFTANNDATPWTTTNKLVPYNQTGTAGSDYEGVTYYSIALPEYQANKAYKITVTVSGGDALESGSAFYAQLGGAITAAPESLDDWTQINGTGAVLTGNYDSDGDSFQLFTGEYINIVLKSENTKDMDKSGYNFTITLDTVA